MDSGPQWRRFAALSIAAIGAVALAHGTSAASLKSRSSASDITLARKVVVPLRVVNRLFPEITRQTRTGRNPTATNNPKATRIVVIYATGDGSKKVTITLDQYASSNDASSAYEQAVQKSQSVPGFAPVAVSDLGQRAFAGTVTMDAETHVGLGLLDGRLIVGVTLAGYDATRDNTAKLVALARTEAAAAKTALGLSGSQ